MMRTATELKKQKLKTILLEGVGKKKRSYSYTINYISRKLAGASEQEIAIIAKALSKEGNDPINVFKFDGRVFMGFQSRKKAYDDDIPTGKNTIHNGLPEKAKKSASVFCLQM